MWCVSTIVDMSVAFLVLLTFFCITLDLITW
jgi:hypothetical protein